MGVNISVIYVLKQFVKKHRFPSSQKPKDQLVDFKK